MAKIKLIEPTSETVNPKLIRLNCLMLALQNNVVYDKMNAAKKYYNWVIEGSDTPREAEYNQSRSETSKL